MNRRIRIKAAVAALALFVAACGDDEESGGTASDVAQLLRECDLLSEGRIPQSDSPGTDAERDAEACFIDCYRSASCVQLEQLLCFDRGPVLSCLNRCVTFECPDGRDISIFDVCDGFADCSGGADEIGCNTFRCGDGEQLPSSWECDGGADCSDGSDEVGCPLYRCRSGEEIPSPWECDFEPDCADGSDELGCAQPICQ